MTILTAGSLSVTQTAMARLREAIEDVDAGPETSIMLAPTLLKVAEIVGNTLASVRQDIEGKMTATKVSTSATMIVAEWPKPSKACLVSTTPSTTASISAPKATRS